MRESPAPGRLVSVRLTDVPLELRLRAVNAAALAHADADRLPPEDRLLVQLRERSDDLLDVARDPSNRVYWITREAYERVLG